MTDTEALWAAVDLIVKPTRRTLIRTPEPEPSTAYPAWIRQLADDPTVIVCSIPIYQAEQRRADAARTRRTIIPSLWDQARTAVGTGSEQTERAGTPLRERSIADLDLMELMLTIREVLGDFHRNHNERIVPANRVPASLRALASAVVRHQPADVPAWTRCIEQWARMLAAKLQAGDDGPHPVRLRNSRCPDCGRRQIVLPTPDGEKVFPPLLIDFTDGMIRAATCSGCGHVWWRGNDLMDLSDELARHDEPHTVFAPGA